MTSFIEVLLYPEHFIWVMGISLKKKRERLASKRKKVGWGE
jgi:hypothetical protein